jgi:hypothetical protein
MFGRENAEKFCYTSAVEYLLGSDIMRLIPVLLVLCVAYSACADTPYFPVRTKQGEAGVTDFEAQWYGKALSRMKEPRLPELSKDTKAVVYRFTILPTWGNPIAVRAQKQDGIFRLSARRLDGEGGYDPGKLVEQKNLKLSETDSKSLDSLVTALKFFHMPGHEDVLGFDGEEWILEGVADGKYHIVQRWSADYDPKNRKLEPFLAFCKFLIDKSTLSERPKNRGHELIPAK